MLPRSNMENQYREKANWAGTFRETFCESFQCPPAAFEEEVFWRCLYRHAVPVAAVLYRTRPELFKTDMDFIHEIGGVKNPDIFKNELNRFHGANVRDKTWLRGAFSVRVSARRLIRLKNQALRNRKSKQP